MHLSGEIGGRISLATPPDYNQKTLKVVKEFSWIAGKCCTGDAWQVDLEPQKGA
jgi:hypothetical protein